jgi:hypothetical protein
VSIPELHERIAKQIAEFQKAFQSAAAKAAEVDKAFKRGAA